jgi:lysozyme family protein
VKENFEFFFNFLLIWEGEYSNHPSDPGGLTIYGVSSKNHPKEVSKMKALYFSGKKLEAKEIAKNIAKKDYWDVIQADNLPDGIDIVCADTAFNSGTKIANKLLVELRTYIKKIMNETPNSGDIPQKIVRNLAVSHLIITRLDLLNDIKTFNVFGKGWTNRLVSLYYYILSEHERL